MKKVFATFSALILLTLSVLGQGIQFENNMTWDQVLKKAESEKKLIFIDAYATWCGPCKLMDSAVFILPEIGNVFNREFINVKVQIDKTKGDSQHVINWYDDALSIEKKYSIDAFPTYLFLSPQGELINRVVGARSASQLAKEAQLALNPDRIYSELLSSFQSNTLAKEDFPELAYLAVKLEQNEVAGKVADEYIKGMNIHERFIPENLKFIATFTTTTNSIGFRFLLENEMRINKILKSRILRDFVQSRVDQIIYKQQVTDRSPEGELLSWTEMKVNLSKYGKRGLEVYKRIVEPMFINNEIIVPIFSSSKVIDWLKVEKELISKYGANGEKAAWSARAYFYFTEKNVPDFIKIKNKILLKYPDLISNQKKGDDAWFVFENAKDSDTASLIAAKVWSKDIVDKDPENGANIDTYANILYRLGQTSEALSWQAKAIIVDPFRKEIRENFEKMKRGEKTWLVSQNISDPK